MNNSNIYKYCSLEAAESIIVSNALKFSSPETFNDPFDCDINLLKFDIDQNMDEQFIEELDKLKSKKWIKEIDKAGQNLLTPEYFENTYKKVQLDKIYNSSVTCFSLDYSNKAMWSHYANNHYGACLVFDINAIERSFELPKSISYGRLDYDNYFSINYFKNREEGIKKLFLTKSIDWKYENEFRIILSNKKGLIKFKKEFLIGIIFGIRTKDDDIQHITNTAERNKYRNLSLQKITKSGLSTEISNL